MLDLKYTYLTLPSLFHSLTKPSFFPKPEIFLSNNQLYKKFNLSIKNKDKLLDVILNERYHEKSFAQAYAGHQFGHFTKLGDGRAIIIGEYASKDNKMLDIQLKGAGITKYSRNGDGKATLRSMLREYLISEAIHYLNIPTSRSLAVIKTGEAIFREAKEDGALLVRIMKSHIRVGTFEYASYFSSMKDLKKLTSYTIARICPEIKNRKNPPLELLNYVMEKQIELVVNWMRIGFVHGVMNTDNTSISGESFDYGPCAFINSYDPYKVFSSIDFNGRYSFGNQAKIIKWNITKFAESLLTIINPNKDKSIILAQSVVDKFDEIWREKYYSMMLKKIGVNSNKEKLYPLVDDLLFIMKKNNLDFTNTFFSLTHENFKTSNIINNIDFIKWKKKRDYIIRNSNIINDSILIMKKSNPIVIPRNNLVHKAIEDAVNGDIAFYNKLLELYSNPYKYKDGLDEFMTPPSSDFEKCFQTYCGT